MLLKKLVLTTLKNHLVSNQKSVLVVKSHQQPVNHPLKMNSTRIVILVRLIVVSLKQTLIRQISPNGLVMDDYMPVFTQRLKPSL